MNRFFRTQVTSLSSWDSLLKVMSKKRKRKVRCHPSQSKSFLDKVREDSWSWIWTTISCQQTSSISTLSLDTSTLWIIHSLGNKRIALSCHQFFSRDGRQPWHHGLSSHYVSIAFVSILIRLNRLRFLMRYYNSTLIILSESMSKWMQTSSIKISKSTYLDHPFWQLDQSKRSTSLI